MAWTMTIDKCPCFCSGSIDMTVESAVVIGRKENEAIIASTPFPDYNKTSRVNPDGSVTTTDGAGQLSAYNATYEDTIVKLKVKYSYAGDAKIVAKYRTVTAKVRYIHDDSDPPVDPPLPPEITYVLGPVQTIRLNGPGIIGEETFGLPPVPESPDVGTGYSFISGPGSLLVPEREIMGGTYKLSKVGFHSYFEEDPDKPAIWKREIITGRGITAIQKFNVTEEVDEEGKSYIKQEYDGSNLTPAVSDIKQAIFPGFTDPPANSINLKVSREIPGKPRILQLLDEEYLTETLKDQVDNVVASLLEFSGIDLKVIQFMDESETFYQKGSRSWKFIAISIDLYSHEVSASITIRWDEVTRDLITGEDSTAARSEVLELDLIEGDPASLTSSYYLAEGISHELEAANNKSVIIKNFIMDDPGNAAGGVTIQYDDVE